MSLLRRLASDTGVMIVTSVHQPSSHVFDSFDQVRAAVTGVTRLTGSGTYIRRRMFYMGAGKAEWPRPGR